MLSIRHGPMKARERETAAGSAAVSRRSAGISRLSGTTRSWSDRLVERLAARARALRVRVVDREARLLERVQVVHLRALQVRRAHLVDDELHAGRLSDDIGLL